ncbi:MAG: hypothetical protein DMF37_11730 [Verrucomicrobia bacterium]|nr:MAG: hypothetical protein DMF37_11730 [Verrucomicrobiota bacterium]
MADTKKSIEQRLEQLHAGGVVDFHFDLLIDLYEKRDRPGVLVSHFLPEFEAGDVGVLGVAIYVEDRYLPEMGLRVALDQVTRLYTEVEQTNRFAICKTFAEIEQARAANKIALVITMEGVEPLGDDLNLLRAFYELGLRSVGLTHARRNAAGSGGIFKPSGSPGDGLTNFGREVVRECERLGILIALAHINPNSDEQITIIGKRGGVIGVNAILVSSSAETSTLDRYVDHIEHVIGLIGIDGVGIGFDFCEYLFQQLPKNVRTELAAKLTTPHFIPDLTNHSHARNLTRKLVERGFSDQEIEKIVRGNWMRILKESL